MRGIGIVILLVSVNGSMQSLIRKRRFAEIMNVISDMRDENVLQAPSEEFVDEYQPAVPYEETDSGYLGPPPPFIYKLLHWDDQHESLGPLFSRLVQLNKDLYEKTDVLQAMMRQNFGVEPEIYSGQDDL